MSTVTLTEIDNLILLHAARQTGRLGAFGFSREVKDRGLVSSGAEARRRYGVLVEAGLLSETPGTPYLCVTIEGVEYLRKKGML